MINLISYDIRPQIINYVQISILLKQYKRF